MLAAEKAVTKEEFQDERTAPALEFTGTNLRRPACLHVVRGLRCPFSSSPLKTVVLSPLLKTEDRPAVLRPLTK